MFTGIVEELGTVISLKRGSKAAVLTIKANVIFEDLKLGDSVAVNGVCLTATHISGNTFQADVMNETFNRSSLGSLKKGSVVNLERAMAANGRFGGHMVAGHVDDTGELVSVKQDDNAVWFTIKAPENIMKYCIEKGSIALDGISLTIAKLSDDTISVSMIPHTIKNTNFGYKKPGDKINLENDMVGKYIDKLLHFDQQETNDKHTNSTLTMEMLRNAGAVIASHCTMMFGTNTRTNPIKISTLKVDAHFLTTLVPKSAITKINAAMINVHTQYGIPNSI